MGARSYSSEKCSASMRCTLKTPVGVSKPERSLDTFHTSASPPGFLTVMRCRLRATKISTLANAGAGGARRAASMTKARSRMFDITRTEYLPAGAGRFVRTNILKYDIVCDVAACGAEVAPGPEVASPVALTKFGELHLNAMRGPALNPAYEIADRNVRR